MANTSTDYFKNWLLSEPNIVDFLLSGELFEKIEHRIRSVKYSYFVAEFPNKKTYRVVKSVPKNSNLEYSDVDIESDFILSISITILDAFTKYLKNTELSEEEISAIGKTMFDGRDLNTKTVKTLLPFVNIVAKILARDTCKLLIRKYDSLYGTLSKDENTLSFGITIKKERFHRQEYLEMPDGEHKYVAQYYELLDEKLKEIVGIEQTYIELKEIGYKIKLKPLGLGFADINEEPSAKRKLLSGEEYICYYTDAPMEDLSIRISVTTKLIY